MATRNANGEGSVYQDTAKGGRWVAAISLPGGRRRRLYAKTRAEAHKKLVAALSEVNRGVVSGAPAEETVGAYLEKWLAGIKGTVRPSTLDSYSRHLRNHAIPTLGRKKLARLGPSDLEALYGQLGDGGLSPTTVRHVHRVLHRALGQAARRGWVATNAAALATPPRPVTAPMHTLDPEQVRRLLAAAAGDRLEALYVVAVTTGMRRGEILALRWRDVDLPAGRVEVHGTKTAGSRRSVALSHVAGEALRRRRQQADAEAEVVGNPGDLVFPSTTGTPLLGPNLLRRSFGPLLERAGLPHVRFHDLRHTAATLLLKRGVHAKVTSEMLGHSRVGITLDLYSHVTPSMQQAAAAAMDDLLGE